MSVKKKLFFSLVAVILFFGIVEFALRLYVDFNPASHVWYRDPYYGILLRRSYEGAEGTTNSCGYRGSEWEPKQSGMIRIGLWGNSTVYGTRVSDNETIAVYLQNELNVLFPGKYQVLNFGIPGMTSQQLALLLHDNIDDFDLDKVVLSIGWNNTYFSLYKNWNTDMLLGKYRGASDGMRVWMSKLKRIMIFRFFEWFIEKIRPL